MTGAQVHALSESVCLLPPHRDLTGAHAWSRGPGGPGVGQGSPAVLLRLSSLCRLDRHRLLPTCGGYGQHMRSCRCRAEGPTALPTLCSGPRGRPRFLAT